MDWTIKYKPKTIDEMILNSNQRRQLQSVLNRQSNCILYGGPGLGKSTFIDIYKARYKDTKIKVVNSRLDGKIDFIRDKILPFTPIQSMVVFFPTEYKDTVVFEEANGLTKDAQEALKVIMDESINTNCFIFTTNKLDGIETPIQDRCDMIEFGTNANMYDDVVSYCKMILNTEKIPYQDKDIEKLVERNYTSIRKTIKSLQAGITIKK